MKKLDGDNSSVTKGNGEQEVAARKKPTEEASGQLVNAHDNRVGLDAKVAAKVGLFTTENSNSPQLRGNDHSHSLHGNMTAAERSNQNSGGNAIQVSGTQIGGINCTML